MAAQVSLRCFWDDPSLHPESPPMYILWQLRDTSQINVGARNSVTKS